MQYSNIKQKIFKIFLQSAKKAEQALKRLLPSPLIQKKQTPTQKEGIYEKPIDNIATDQILSKTIPIQNRPLSEMPTQETDKQIQNRPLPEIPTQKEGIYEKPIDNIATDQILSKTIPIQNRPLSEIPAQEEGIYEKPIDNIARDQILSKTIPIQNRPLSEIPAQEEGIYEKPIDNIARDQILSKTIPIQNRPLSEMPTQETDKQIQNRPLPEIPTQEEGIYEKPIDRITPKENIHTEQADSLKSKNHIYETIPAATTQQQQNYHKAQSTEQSDSIKSTTEKTNTQIEQKKETPTKPNKNMLYDKALQNAQDSLRQAISNTSPDSNTQNNNQQQASSRGMSR